MEPTEGQQQRGGRGRDKARWPLPPMRRRRTEQRLDANPNVRPAQAWYQHFAGEGRARAGTDEAVLARMGPMSPLVVAKSERRVS